MKRRDFLRVAGLGAAGLLSGVALSANQLLGDTPTIVEPALPSPIESDCPPLIRAIRLGQVDTVKSLVKQGADIKECWGKYAHSPLHWACKPSALEQVKRIHFYDPDLETHPVEEFYGYRRSNPQAGWYRDSVTLLSEAGIDWRPQVKNDGSPIHLPGRMARRKIVKFLVDSGADIEALSDWDDTPLFCAAETSDIELIQYLFRLGVNRDTTDRYNRTFASHAAARSDVKMMQFLVESGIDVHAYKDDDGNTLLHYAAINYDISVMKYLIDLGLDPHAKTIHYRQPIHSAACSGCIEAVRYLVSLGADINAIDRYGSMLLHLTGDIRIARFLIDAGADIEAEEDNYGGGMPLHSAASKNHPRLAEMLLNAGANIEACDEYEKETPLHIAAGYGNSEAAKFLIDSGANLTAKNKNGDTPLHTAASLKYAYQLAHERYGNMSFQKTVLFTGEYIDTVQTLLDAGADVEAVNNDNVTPLRLAMCLGNLKMADYIIGQGADLTSFTYDADVILVAPENLTIALAFKPGEPFYCNRLIARGNGWIGEQIRKVARKKNISVVECKPSFAQDIFDKGYHTFRHDPALLSICADVLREQGLTYNSEKDEFVKIVPANTDTGEEIIDMILASSMYQAHM